MTSTLKARRGEQQRADAERGERSSRCGKGGFELKPEVCRARRQGGVGASAAVQRRRLATEAVEGAALALEGVDDVHGGDGLAAGVLGVGDGVTDDGLHEGLEDTAGLLVDQAGDALDATTASQAADGRLGDALDVVPEHLAVALDASTMWMMINV